MKTCLRGGLCVYNLLFLLGKNVGWGTWIRTRTNGVRVFFQPLFLLMFPVPCRAYVALSASKRLSAAAKA